MPSYEFNLNVDPGGMPPVIHLAQYDSARTYYANLKQDGVAYYTGLGTTAKIKGRNNAGVCWEQSCTIDSSHLDQVVFTPSGAATDQFGIMPVQMELTDTNGVISTLLMVWDIQKAGYTSEEAARSPEFETALEAAVAAAIAQQGLGFTEEFKTALLDIAAHVAWDDANGQSRYDALEAALYPETHLVSITASYDQDRPIYNIDTQEEAYAKIALDLSVTANYSDGTSDAVTGYTLSGTLEVGTNTVTVTYEGKTTTISVLVLSYIPAEYQQVEWIGMDGRGSSDNERYVDLGFTPTLTTGLKFRMRATGTQVANFFGIRQTTSGNNNAMLMLSYSSSHKIGVARWGSATELIPYDTNWHDYEIMPNSIKVDGTEYTLADPVSGQSITTQTLRLFGVYANVSGTLKWFDGGTHDIGGIFYAYNGTALSGEFVPCYRKSDNKIGMYDRVGEAFHEGHGTLEKGSNV